MIRSWYGSVIPTVALLSAFAATAAAQQVAADKFPAAEQLQLKTKDGVQIIATSLASNKGKDAVPVILLHMFKGNRRDLEGLGVLLQQLHELAEEHAGGLAGQPADALQLGLALVAHQVLQEVDQVDEVRPTVLSLRLTILPGIMIMMSRLPLFTLTIMYVTLLDSHAHSSPLGGYQLRKKRLS